MCAGKKTHDAAVFRNIADGSFSSNLDVKHASPSVSVMYLTPPGQYSFPPSAENLGLVQSQVFCIQFADAKTLFWSGTKESLEVTVRLALSNLSASGTTANK